MGTTFKARRAIGVPVFVELVNSFFRSQKDGKR